MKIQVLLQTMVVVGAAVAPAAPVSVLTFRDRPEQTFRLLPATLSSDRWDCRAHRGALIRRYEQAEALWNETKLIFINALRPSLDWRSKRTSRRS